MAVSHTPAPAPPRQAAAADSRFRRGDGWWALLFLAPSLAGILIFVAGPILASVVISMTDWRLASPLSIESLRNNWLGLENYRDLLSWREADWSLAKHAVWRWPLLAGLLLTLSWAVAAGRMTRIWGAGLGVLAAIMLVYFAGIEAVWNDRRFWSSFFNTVYFVGLSVPLTIACAMGLAIALNRPMRGIALYRAAYFMPIISGAVAVSLVWRWMFNPTIGPVNQFLELLGISGPAWLTDRSWAMPAIIITDVWSNMGFFMVIFLAGLQSIPDHYYEAAAIDGAGAFQKFWNVTLPLLSPTTFLNSILALITAFQMFTLPYIMTDGGPAGATRVLVLYMYERAFSTPFRMGYGTAVAWILFAILFLLTALQWYVRKHWVVYEDEGARG